MSIERSITVLEGIPEWKSVLEYLNNERETLLNDFHSAELMTQPYVLARIGGEIATIDRILKQFENEQR